jgi:hypothetical protein
MNKYEYIFIYYDNVDDDTMSNNDVIYNNNDIDVNDDNEPYLKKKLFVASLNQESSRQLHLER